MPEERKLVTILFADVTGSTALGDALDPEDVRALMSRYFAHARRVVAAHGGTIEKFIGDAVMVVFGLAQAHGDDAERALAAALALRDALAGDTVLGPSFQLRMGVNTGEVVATGDPSSGDFLITGDAVNVAARLEQHANPGEIVASERTVAAARTAFTFDEPRSVEVKGKPLPLLVYPLVGMRATRQAERPPLVGRRQDLLQLELLKERAVEERRPQLVSILAPAGTGKTRLLEEFLARLDPAEGFRVATARCLPYGQTLTYWPLRGLLTGLLGGDPTRSAVAEAFAQGGYGADDAARLADRALTTLGVETGAEADRESIFMAWRLLLEVFARQAPRIVVFEDLHWASDSLLDLVEHVIHFCTDAPLVIIALSRPELLDRRPTWGGGWKNFTALTLQPLTPAQTRELVGKILAQALDDARERIVERSSGNPFFALELARSVSERAQSGAVSSALPDTVHAAVLARLDLLTPEERAALQAASVAGRAFRAEMICAALPTIDLPAMETALADLAARDLLAPQEGGVFAFRHILIRDVAYGTLARPERIRIHVALATWLEQTAGDRQDEFIDLIAYHYREALTLARQSVAPLATPIDPARAVAALRRAGEMAGRAGAYTEARSLLQMAIQLAPESERMALYEQLGDSMPWGGAPYAAYQDALACWRAAGGGEAHDTLTGARIYRKLLTVCLRGFVPETRDPAVLTSLYNEGLALAERAADPDELRRVLILRPFLAMRAQQRLDLQEVSALRAEAWAAADDFVAQQDWTAFSTALDGYSSLSIRLGAFDDMRVGALRRLATPELAVRERGDAIAVLTMSYYAEGDYSGCVAAFREQLARRRVGEPNTYLTQGVSLTCGAAFEAGQWDELEALLPTLMNIWEQVKFDDVASFMLTDGFLAALRMAMAREDRAASDVAFSALTQASPESLPGHRTLVTAFHDDDPTLLMDGPSMVDSGESQGALLFLSEHGIVAPTEYRTRLRMAKRPIDSDGPYLAIAQALADDDNDALALAIDEAERHHLVVHAARMRIVLAQRTGDRAHLDLARPTLERLQDRVSLRRLAEVAASIG
ncbi:MAG TPA: adenylate/guanylate cyclase domain-containing protein [Ktedonobacterales bacterium]|nr:adenylate/guanylate cyclase domain-containing protein [Ktedonobacterales bacterium]